MRYYIDGYNLFFYLFKSHDPFKKKRQEFISFLIQNLSHIKEDVLIIFDGQSEEIEILSIANTSIRIIFTKKALSADNFIIEEIKYFIKKEKIIVITNDKALSISAKHLEAKVIKLSNFIKTLTKSHQLKQQAKPHHDSDKEISRLKAIFKKKLK